ncbi:SpoIIE family protein phosphatase [Actinoplanes nipponensis]|uniref:SpoIIE family protein phosphatase n=1 Tax=Actinoplanes nipponensis TaxID=135950 RepID=UPI0031E7ED34
MGSRRAHGPAAVRRDARTTELPVPRGLLVGRRRRPVPGGRGRLAPADLIMFYTDGLVETARRRRADLLASVRTLTEGLAPARRPDPQSACATCLARPQARGRRHLHPGRPGAVLTRARGFGARERAVPLPPGSTAADRPGKVHPQDPVCTCKRAHDTCCGVAPARRQGRWTSQRCNGV